MRKRRLRKDVVAEITKLYGVTGTTVYQWYKGASPMGRRAGRVAKVSELLYVVGALLGDGCVYHWRGNYQVWLSGEKPFVRKYASKLSLCLGRQVRYYKPSSKNVWIARVGNAELFFLFQRVRDDLSALYGLVEETGTQGGWLQFIEGIFDAEGCVKIVAGRERRTPKACLDLCNTDIRLVRAAQGAIRNELGIESRLSIQPGKPPRRTSYHLRIYSKAGVEAFLGAIPTTKLTAEKKPLVELWLTKSGRESPTSRLSRACRPRRTS